MDDKKIWHDYIKGNLGDIDSEFATKIDLVSDPEKIILDLHNYTEAEAYNLLKASLKQAEQISCPKLIIITGKGSDYPASPGRLFSIVPQWLDTIQDQGKIISYKVKIEGALEVLIKLDN